MQSIFSPSDREKISDIRVPLLYLTRAKVYGMSSSAIMRITPAIALISELGACTFGMCTMIYNNTDSGTPPVTIKAYAVGLAC